MAYEGGMGYQLHMPSYFWRTFTEYPRFIFSKDTLGYSVNVAQFILFTECPYVVKKQARHLCRRFQVVTFGVYCTAKIILK